MFHAGDQFGSQRRMQRAPDRTSPTRQYHTPLPKIGPLSPNYQSREDSPAYITENGGERQPFSDSQESSDTNISHNDQIQRPDPHGDRKHARRDDDRHPQARNVHKDNRQSSPRREAAGKLNANVRQPSKDAYRSQTPDEPENSDPENVLPPIDRGSSQRSRDSSPTRRGAAGGAHKGANYERDAAYTNHTNEDSRVADLTPEEKNRNKENYYDEHMR